MDTYRRAFQCAPTRNLFGWRIANRALPRVAKPGSFTVLNSVQIQLGLVVNEVAHSHYSGSRFRGSTRASMIRLNGASVTAHHRKPACLQHVLELTGPACAPRRMGCHSQSSHRASLGYAPPTPASRPEPAGAAWLLGKDFTTMSATARSSARDAPLAACTDMPWRTVAT